MVAEYGRLTMSPASSLLLVERYVQFKSRRQLLAPGSYCLLAVCVSTSRADCESDPNFAAVNGENFSAVAKGRFEPPDTAEIFYAAGLISVGRKKRGRKNLRSTNALGVVLLLWWFPSRGRVSIFGYEQQC